MPKEIIIKCAPLKFYCQNDEEALFDWLAKIKSIHTMQGVGTNLLLIFKDNNIPDEDLIDLMGVFKRYAFANHQQLKLFMNQHNEHRFD